MPKFLKVLLSITIVTSFVLQMTSTAFGETINELKAICENTEPIVNTVDETTDEYMKDSYILGEENEKREEFVKHYITEDKDYIAAVYDNPVHYLDDNGNWIDYDNSLYKTVDSKNDVYYKNTSSNVSVSFAENPKSKNVVNIKKDGYRISWGFVDSNISVKADENQTEAFTTVDETESTSSINRVNSDILTPEITKESNSTVNDCKLDIVQNESSTKDQRLNEAKAKNSVEEYNKEFIALEHLKSTVKYNNLYDSTNIEYSIISNTVKENIELVDNKASNRISFLVEHEGLKADLTTDGRIVFTNENKTVFSFDIPFAYDAKEVYTDKVNYELQNFENSSLVTIVLDKEWFCDNDRKFPIIIDPVTQTEQTTDNISEAFVASWKPNSHLGGNGGVQIGRESSEEGDCYTYIKFEQLPSIGHGDIIVGANFNIVQRPTSLSGFSSNYSSELKTYAYEVTSAWNENTITWNNAPNRDSTDVGDIIDYNILTGHDDFTWVSYDVSKLMRKWYNISSSNNGIVIKGDIPNGNYYTITRFLTSNHPQAPSNAYPVGTVCYRNATGLEDYWCYQSQTIGNNGNGYVNVFNGNLTFTQLVGVTSTTLTPASVSLIYDLTNKDTPTGRAGYGWRISAVQRVDSNNDSNWSSQYPYYYTDGDGTKHYFYNNNGIYNDEDGLGLTYTAVNDGTNIKHKITTKDGAVSKFDNNGYLREYTDPNSHKTTYTYNGDYLTQITDPFGKTLTLEYNTSIGRITSVTDDVGNTATFNYDGNTLIRVNYKGYTTSFNYDAHKMTSASNPLGNGIEYSYLVDYGVDYGISRISQVSVKSIDGTRTGSSFKLSYKDGITTSVTDPGLDGTYNTGDDKLYTYNFDKFGRCNDIYDNKGNANTYKYYTNQTGSNIKKNNALLKSGSTQKTVCNYLKNTNFTVDTDNWTSFNMGNSTPCSIQTAEFFSSGENDISVDSIMFMSNVSGTSGVAQSVSLSSGTYTFSAYIKASEVTKTLSNGGFGIAVIYDNNQVEKWSELVDGYTDFAIDNGWRKVSITFNLSETSSRKFYCGFKDAYGTAYMKCPQLEKADGPSNYNIIENAGFEETTLDKWTQHKSNPSNGVGNATITTDTDNVKYDNRALNLPGALKEWNNVTQVLNISGNKGDVYALSAWTKACAKAATDENTTNKPKYAIEIELKYTDSDSDKETIYCNTEVTDWQYAAGIIAAKKAYNSIQIHLCYDYQVNNAIFDGIQLIRDNAGSYQYDDNGNLISTTDAVKNSQYSYDGNSNITQIQNPTGTKYNYSYDLKNQMITAKDSYGTQYSINYSDKGNPIDTSSWGKYTENTNLSSLTDKTSYYIKSVNNGKYFDVVNFSTGNGSILKLCSLNQGENQKFKFVKSGTDAYRLMPNHVKDKMIKFTSSGLVQDVYDSSSTDGKFTFTKITGTNKYYIKDKKTGKKLSASGNNITLVSSSTTGSSVEWELSECGKHIDTAYNYDDSDEDLLISIVDSRGKTTSYTYDNKARVVSTTNANGNTTSTTYDDTTSQIESISAQNGSNTSTIQYVYNSNYTQLIGIKREDPTYRYYNFSYDDFGNLSQTKVGNQVLSTNTYNEKTGLLTNSTYGNGNYIDYIYDTDYNLTTKKYNGTDKFKYSYDSSGNLTLKNDLVNNIKTTYIYDLIGRIVGMTADNGVTLSKGYDDFGRVKMNIVRIGSVLTRTQYVYGDSSQGQYQDGIYAVKLDGNDILSYNYDELGRLDEKTLNCGNATLTSTYSYYSGYGSTDATTNFVNQYNNGVINYKYLYDDLGNITRIVDITAGIPNATVLAEYEYDDFNQLVCEHNSQIGKTIRYTYDGYGNILTKSEYTLNAPANATPTLVYNYGYDTGAWKDRLTSYGSFQITYDSIGNPLEYINGATFTWQNGRQLATANRSGKDLTFKYDDNGIRTEKVCVSYPASGTKTETTKYYLDGSTILAQETTGVLETSIYGMITTTNLATVRLDFFYDETGDVVGFKYNGNKYFYIKNLQGDVTDIVDNTGAIVVSYLYDTWGKVKSTTGTMASTLGSINPFRYRSYYYDKELSLYYLQSRYYDPNTGRFINADGYVSTGTGILGYNMFAYCKNNPVNSVDPTGECDSTQAARQEHILYMKNQKAHISTPTVFTVNYNAVVYDDYNVKKIINSVTYVPSEETLKYHDSMLKESRTNLAVDVTVFAVGTVLIFTPCPEVSALLYAYDLIDLINTAGQQSECDRFEAIMNEGSGVKIIRWSFEGARDVTYSFNEYRPYNP